MTTHIEFAEPFDFNAAVVQQVLKRAVHLPDGILVTHVELSKTLVDVGHWYVQYYNGSNEFMNSLKAQHKRKGRLTNRQIACALNDMLRNAPQSIETDEIERESLSPTVVESDLLDGIYTIVLDETGIYRTIKITTLDAEQAATYNQPKGTQIASYLSGLNNESDYTGFAFVQGRSANLFKRFKSDTVLASALFALLKADKQGRIDMGTAYALESGRCWVCNRLLTTPESIIKGIGPVCAKKVGNL